MKDESFQLSPEEETKAARIAFLILGFIDKRLSPDEEKELDTWIDESAANLRIFEESTNKQYVNQMYQAIETFHGQQRK